MKKFAAALLMCVMLATLPACRVERRHRDPDSRPSAYPLAVIHEEQTQAKQTEGLAAQAASTGTTEATSGYEGEDTASEPKSYDPVKLILQNPELPNGCETASLAMILGSVGQPIDMVELYRDYLPKGDFRTDSGVRYGPDPEQYFVGDAASRTGGWYCFEGPIVQAANDWLEVQGSILRARAVTGLSREELDEYARLAVPAAVWVTLGYAAPQYSSYTWLLEDGTEYYPYRNLHCVVLAGTEGDGYRIADPINGFQTVDCDTFWASFFAMDSRAVIIE